MPDLRSHAHFLAPWGHLDLGLKKITHNCVISQSKPPALEEMVLGGHNRDKCSLYLLSLPGGGCFAVPFFVKRTVMPTELHMHGLSQNVVVAQMSGKKPKAHQAEEKNTPKGREPCLYSSNNSEVVYGVHESALHQLISVCHPLGKVLRT